MVQFYEKKNINVYNSLKLASFCRDHLIITTGNYECYNIFTIRQASLLLYFGNCLYLILFRRTNKILCCFLYLSAKYYIFATLMLGFNWLCQVRGLHHNSCVSQLILFNSGTIVSITGKLSLLPGPTLGNSQPYP